MNKLLFFLLFPLLFSAQTHRFIYEYHYKTNPENTEYEKTNMHLDINPDEVKFYERAYAENDSLNKVRTYFNTIWNDTPQIIRKRSSGINRNYVLMNAYYVYETEDKINWKLSDETKTSGNYQLQKATADFGGRSWIAWFAKDLNLSEGPYKFRGLPGMIFEVEDTAKNFLFKLVKSQKFDTTYDTKDFIESFAREKALPVNLKTVQKKQLEQFNDPLQEMRENFDPNMEGEFRVMNIKVTSKDQFPELTRIYQNYMRKNHNPLEPANSVKYPEK